MGAVPGTLRHYPEVWRCSPCPPCLRTNATAPSGFSQLLLIQEACLYCIQTHGYSPSRPGLPPLGLACLLSAWPASSLHGPWLSPSQSVNFVSISPRPLHCHTGPQCSAKSSLLAPGSLSVHIYNDLFGNASKVVFFVFQWRYNLHKVH